MHYWPEGFDDRKTYKFIYVSQIRGISLGLLPSFFRSTIFIQISIISDRTPLPTLRKLE
jgi:hypothetical protein